MRSRDELLADFPVNLQGMRDSYMEVSAYHVERMADRIRELEAAKDDGQKYVVALHRMIEAHCRGERVSDSASPHIAAMLNAQLVSKSYTLAASEPVAWGVFYDGKLGFLAATRTECEAVACFGATITPLYSAPPSAAGVTVTEAMVNAAARRGRDYGFNAYCDNAQEYWAAMESVLTAALTAASEGASDAEA